jgi:hypothetical protein
MKLSLLENFNLLIVAVTLRGVEVLFRTNTWEQTAIVKLSSLENCSLLIVCISDFQSHWNWTDHVFFLPNFSCRLSVWTLGTSASGYNQHNYLNRAFFLESEQSLLGHVGLDTFKIFMTYVNLVPLKKVKCQHAIFTLDLTGNNTCLA